MKLHQLVNAFPGLQKIAACDMGMKDLYAVTKKIREVTPHLDFYAAQIRKIGDDADKRVELLNLDIEMSPAVTITPPETLRLSYSDIVFLSEIVEIKFEEDNKED